MQWLATQCTVAYWHSWLTKLTIFHKYMINVTLNCILLLIRFTCCCLLWMWFQKYGQLQDTQSFNSSHDLLLTKAIEFKSVCSSLNLWKHVTLNCIFDNEIHMLLFVVKVCAVVSKIWTFTVAQPDLCLYVYQSLCPTTNSPGPKPSLAWQELCDSITDNTESKCMTCLAMVASMSALSIYVVNHLATYKIEQIR